MFILYLFVTSSLLCSGSAHWEDSDTDDILNLLRRANVYKTFRHWMLQNNKVYDDLRSTWDRFQIFKDNVAKVIQMNEKSNGLAVFGLTEFADLTPLEFIQLVLNGLLKPDIPDRSDNHTNVTGIVHESFDWTKEGVETAVRDQGNVGTCYIFTALDVIASRWRLKGHDPVNLSHEQVADCLAFHDDRTSEKMACGINGGVPQAVYEYIKNVGGITREEDYPYCVGSGRCKPCAPEGYFPRLCGMYPIQHCVVSDSCKAKLRREKFVPGLKVARWNYVTANEEQLAIELERYGPLAAALDAADLQLYRKGIIVPDKCRSQNINHAVLLVGYGSESGTKFWRLKNSWGREFGENGYFRIARDIGACGINQFVTNVELE
ncbi:procathepsin L-like [Physella acuta]|uniref:procathepsin L-like n=1 Tax=Physella acuta TaxID=109671 RepID=UPI0027DCE65D|nr:procathepsin L-like [Physella acuta]